MKNTKVSLQAAIQDECFFKTMVLMLDNSPLLYWVTDIQERFIYVNPAFLQFFSGTAERYLNHRAKDLDRNHVEYTCEPELKENFLEFNFLLNNQECWLEININRIHNFEDKTSYIFYTAKNITEQKLKEKEACKKEIEFSIVQRINKEISADLNLYSLFTCIRNSLKDLVDFQHFSILEYDEENRKLNSLLETECGIEPYDLFYKRYALPAAENNETVYITDKEIVIPGYPELVSDYNIRCAILVPFTDSLNKRYIVTMTRNRYGYLTAQELEYLSLVMDQTLKQIYLCKKVRQERRMLLGSIDTLEQAETLFDDNQHLLVAFDKNGMLLNISRSFVQLLGYDQEELKHTSVRNIIFDQDLQGMKNSLFYLRSNDYLDNFSHRCLNRDGVLLYFQWNLHWIKKLDMYIGLANLIDRETFYESRAQLLQKQVEFEHLRSEFFANISHEFKTPINITLAASQLLLHKAEKNGIDQQEVVKTANYIQTNSYRLMRLVSNLIDLSKIDSGSLTPHFERFDLVPFLESIVNSTEEYAKMKNIKIYFLSHLKECQIMADPGMIDRIVLNLLSNSIKYSYRNNSIKLVLSLKDGKIQLQIIDRGIGIGAENIRSIFERFKKADNSLTRVVEGSGIGLAIVKSLVELHHGEIITRSEPVLGTIFTIRLPIEQRHSPVPSRSEEEMDEMENQRRQQIRIEFSDFPQPLK